jgi:hypothetical protein
MSRETFTSWDDYKQDQKLWIKEIKH